MKDYEEYNRSGSDCVILAQRFVCKLLPNGAARLLKVTAKPEDPSKPEDLTLPACIESIEEKAFDGLSLSSVTFEKDGRTLFFPVSHSYYMRILLDGFGKNGRLYDYTEYDRFLLVDHFNTERIRMICARITDPQCDPDTKHRLRENVLNHTKELAEALLKNADTDSLDQLADAGLFTAESLSEIIEAVNRSRRKELLFWLLDYRNRTFPPSDDFDFTI